MTERIITDSNGRKYITNEPLLHRPAPVAEPRKQEPVAWIVEDQSGERLEWASDAHSCHGVPTFPLYTSPPTLSLAQRIVLPDAITDDSESPEYRTGWNECREVMRGMMK